MVRQEDPAPLPPHPQLVLCSLSVLLTGILVGVQCFAFLEGWARSHLPVYAACFSCVSAGTRQILCKTGFVVWLLNSSSGFLCASQASSLLVHLLRHPMGAEEGPSSAGHSWAPNSTGTWLWFLRHLPLGGGINTVTSGQAGLAFRLSEHVPTVPLLNARACGREKQFSRWGQRGGTAC